MAFFTSLGPGLQLPLGVWCFPLIGPACISSSSITVFIMSFPCSKTLKGSLFSTTSNLICSCLFSRLLLICFFLTSPALFLLPDVIFGSCGLEIMEFLYTHTHPNWNLHHFVKRNSSLVPFNKIYPDAAHSISGHVSEGMWWSPRGAVEENLLYTTTLSQCEGRTPGFWEQFVNLCHFATFGRIQANVGK